MPNYPHKQYWMEVYGRDDKRQYRWRKLSEAPNATRAQALAYARAFVQETVKSSNELPEPKPYKMRVRLVTKATRDRRWNALKTWTIFRDTSGITRALLEKPT